MMHFQEECKKCAWAFNRDWDNIEELYTQADLLRLARHPDVKEAEDLCQKIAWAIWDVYREFNAKKYPPMNAILEGIATDGYRPVVLTTNYDVLCEFGIRQNNSDWSYYYSGFDPPWSKGAKDHKGKPRPIWPLKQDIDGPLEPTDMEKAVPIIKLHGSVNWFRYDDEHNLVASTLMGKEYPDGAIDDPAFRIDRFWKVLKAYTEVEGEPFPAIIPPMLGKMSVSPGIAVQWRAAIHFLETAARILIVGYSFPETDAFMTRLLAEGLKRNNGLEEIAIVDIQAEEQWAERLERIFTPTLRQTKLKYQRADAREFLNSLARAGRPKGKTAVGTRTFN
jgi:hypothetical protein